MEEGRTKERRKGERKYLQGWEQYGGAGRQYVQYGAGAVPAGT